MTLGYLAHGGPGLFFDQEYGIVAYAPVLALAFIGLIHMLRAGGDEARRALEVTMVLAALVATVGAFHIWWGGSAAPGRPVASAVLLLGVPIASFFAAARERPAARAACQALLAISVAVALALATKQDGSLLHNDRDGTATLLEWMSPTWPLTSVFPSFIRQPLGGAAARTLGWLMVGGLVALGARLLSPRRIGAASLAFVALGVAAGVVYASATRPATAPTTIDPTARASVPLLDDFDAHRRPIVVVYDPWTRTSAADVLARAVLIARPGQRTSRQPVELLWNARFALPAGEYRMDLTRPSSSVECLGQSDCRSVASDPRSTNGASKAPPGRAPSCCRSTQALIGLRPLANGGLDAGELRITPVRVVDESRRSARPPVLSASSLRTADRVLPRRHDDG
jgi:hypothetical protein